MLRQLLLPLVCLPFLTPTTAAQIKSVRDTTRARVGAPAGPVSAHEAERFGIALEEAVRLGDLAECEAQIDWNTICTKATNGIPASDKVRKDFRAATDASLRGTTGLFGSAIATVGAGGTFRFLRLVERGSQTLALFRIAHADGGMPQYVALLLEADSEGAALATDIDQITDGGFVSARLRRFFLALAGSSTRGLEDKVRGPDKLRAHHLKDLDAAEEGFLAGQNKAALESLDRLPAELRGALDVVLLRLNVARSISASAFSDALEDARTRLPRNASIELIALDHFVVTGAHADARKALAAASAAIGGDPYLDWLDATIADAAGDLDLARDACRRAIGADPSLQEAWWTLLSIAVRQDQFTEAALLLDRMSERFEVDWNGLAAAPAYATFFASDAGRAWRAKR